MSEIGVLLPGITVLLLKTPWFVWHLAAGGALVVCGLAIPVLPRTLRMVVRVVVFCSAGCCGWLGSTALTMPLYDLQQSL